MDDFALGRSRWWYLAGLSQLVDRCPEHTVDILFESCVKGRFSQEPLDVGARKKPTPLRYGNEVGYRATLDRHADGAALRHLSKDTGDVVSELPLGNLSLWLGHATTVACRRRRSQDGSRNEKLASASLQVKG